MGGEPRGKGDRTGMDPVRAAAGGLVVTLGGMTLLWAVSVRRRDASIVDGWWGMGFALLSLFYAAATDGYGPRSVLAVALTWIWGARLSVHIHLRNRGRPEDARYAAWREAAGPRFWWKSWFSVFLLQGALMWLISAPLLVAQAAAQPDRFTWLDGLGALVWGIGFVFETAGDEQLRRFRADPARRGQVLDTGLWAWTRHPNYFGDAMVWWGLFLIAAAVPGGLLTIVSPVLMTVLLLRISGVTLLEEGLRKTRPGYDDYAARTSAFFPLPPRAPRSGRSGTVT